MSRRLVLVERLEHVPPAAADTDVLVLDASWTPLPTDRQDLIPLRPSLAGVLDRINLFDGSLDVLDRWAAASGAADVYRIGDITWWFRVRLTARWPIHEVMLWDAVLREVAPDARYQVFEVPAARPWLAAAVRLHASGDTSSATVVERPPVADQPGSAAPARIPTLPDAAGASPQAAVGEPGATERRARRRPPLARRIVRDLLRRVRGGPSPEAVALEAERRRAERAARARARRDATLEGRIEELRSRPGAVLVVATAGFFQLIESPRGPRFADPHLAPLADGIAGRDVPVVTLGLQLDHHRRADWRLIESDPTLVPQSLLKPVWGDPGDEEIDVPDVDLFLAGDASSVTVDGWDYGPIIRAALADEYGTDYLQAQARAVVRTERMIRDLAPRTMVLDHEGGRTAYLAAAHRSGVPVVAVQHGIIFSGNPEYCHPTDPLLVRQDVTCVYGEFEREVLVACGFGAANIAITGSSRAETVLAGAAPSADERASVRHELGVADGDRMLVVSLAHNPVAGDLHTVNMVARTLGGPLPGVHVVLKLHPQEAAEQRYERTLRLMAEAGGYEAPRMTVIRDFDLYRLLRSADAHLGQYSTILTDAVVAGIPNMIAVGYAWSDLLAYVDAGVATPVRSVDDVRTFMADPRAPAAADRDAFLAAHFLTGDATARVVDVVLGLGASGDRRPGDDANLGERPDDAGLVLGAER
ncbi:MAG TPA: hypothetical protein VGK63_00095 [Candidatus Limnocylindrales bacterium]